jgi:regulator of protease activity HflC (stomatin/prohibitin superfamily)
MSNRSEPVNVKAIAVYVVTGVVLLCIAFGFMGSCYTVPAGNRAVVLTFGSVDMAAKGEGLHLKIPFVQKAVRMSVQTQKYSTDVSAASTDLQMVSTQVAVNYHPEPESMPAIYKGVGLQYSDKLIQPIVQECVKSCTAQYKAEELITQREDVKQRIDAMLKSRLAERDIIVEAVSITSFDFSKSFNEAIEAKVTAEQTALAAKNKLEQVKYEAEQAVTKAKGEAEAIRIQAEAIQSQGGKDYVQLKAVEKWDGKMPVYTGGALPFIDVSKPLSKESQ